MNTIIVRHDQMYPYSILRPIPKGQSQFSRVRFVFSKEWVGREKIAQFVQGENPPINIPILGDECPVPKELDIGFATIYLRGYSEKDLSIATANGVTIEIVRGFNSGGMPPVPPTPDLYQQLIEKYKQFNSKPPIIGENGNWFLWDGEKYVDSGNPSRGESNGITTTEKAEVINSAILEIMSIRAGVKDGVSYVRGGSRIKSEIRNSVHYIFYE